MKKAVRSHFVTLHVGDVAGVAVIHFTDHTRLVIHDHDSEVPLIQLVVSDLERHRLIEALHECFSTALPERRPFRARRPRSS